MLAVARAFDDEAWVRIVVEGLLRTQGCERSMDQLAQGVFHGGIQSAAGWLL